MLGFPHCRCLLTFPGRRSEAGRNTGTTLVPEELIGTIDAIGRRDGATLFITLLTAWALFASRLPAAGRFRDRHAVRQPAPQGVRVGGGLLLNMLPLRVDMSGLLTFRDALNA